MRVLITTLSVLGVGWLCVYTVAEYNRFLATDTPLILVEPYHAPKLPPEKPLRISIPKIDINTPIIPLGLDAQGLMKVPKTAGEVAWYEPGTIPGKNGNAVLAGHYDWIDGPAVFYRIGELEMGDTIIITDERSQSWRFTVTEKNSYPAHEFPVETVFQESAKPILNLITCDGIFDTNRNSYSNRIVVSAIRTDIYSKSSDKSSLSEQY